MSSMKTYGFLLVLIAALSCEKVLDIETQQQEKKWVIEAELRSGKQWFTVYISKSAGYFDGLKPEAIVDATVTLSSDEDSVWNLSHHQNGEYADSIEVEPNHMYTLEVEHKGMKYTARSFMHPPVNIGEVSYEYTEENPPISSEGYRLTFTITDPIEAANYYRTVYYIDSAAVIHSDNLQIHSDRFRNGTEIQRNIRDEDFKSGDEITIELRHISQESYDYLSAVEDIAASQGALSNSVAAPGNPPSNWDGDVLGYFGAYSVDTVVVVLN